MALRLGGGNHEIGRCLRALPTLNESGKLIGEGRGHLVDLPVPRGAVKKETDMGVMGKGAGREARPVRWLL